MEKKKCTVCNEIKKVTEFETIKCSKTKKKYKRNVCKKCKAKDQKNYYINNYSNLRLNQKKYNLINAKKIKEQRKIYYQINKEQISKQKKIYNLINVEKIKKQRRMYYLNNKEEILNKTTIYRKKKYKDDTLFYLKCKISHRIREHFKAKKMLKNNKTVEILGCNSLLLKKHLENQFILNMSWGNRSEWHIDHIIPLKAAKTEFEVIALNHYTNLQPLWAKDNLTKKDSYNIEDFDNYINWYVKNVRTEEEYNSLTL